MKMSSRSFVRVALACALLALSSVPLLSQEGAPSSGWKRSATARKAHGNYRVTATALPLEMQVTSKSGGRQALVTVSADAVTVEEVLPGGGRRRQPSRFVASGAVASGAQEVLLKVRDLDWSVYVGGSLRAIVAAPFVLPGTISVRAGAPVGKDAKFLPVPGANFVTDFMIEEGAKNELEPWTIQTGGWHLHTALAQALARPETSQADAKRAPLTADKSPNFYSLKGGGKNVDNVITAGYEVYDDYQMTVSIQLDDGEAGLVFYHRDAPAAEGQKPDPAKAEFYAFTLRMNRPAPGMNEVRLWRQRAGQRQLLARAEVPLFKSQWYLPGIAAHGDEIICYLDHSELFRVREPLPPGGKFGMFANTPEEVRMDDVAVRPYLVPKLDTPDHLAYHRLAASGKVDVSGKDAVTVALGADGKGAQLLLGRTHSENLVFSADVRPSGKTWNVGLVAGWQGDQAPRLVFTVQRAADGAETYVLREQTGSGSRDLSSLTLPAAQSPGGGSDAAFTLMADATEKGLVRFLKNGRTVLIHALPDALTGAYGLVAAPGTALTASNLTLDSDRGVLKELKQKNPVFEHDSFMRHWASPEGQWIAGKGDALWHKGDFFGDFRMTMPCIPGSDLHLAVADDQTDGPVSVAINGNSLVLRLAEPNRAQPLVRTLPLTPPQGKGVDALDYTLHAEGHQLWIVVGKDILVRESLAQPLRTFGTRVRVKGMSVAQLARSRVTRSNVIDEFFNESPFAWLQNGGDWQIINRFQCTPSWSHMIAECYETMGAFWRKQVFTGDMTLEFYAGSRHGSYDCMGNLNCTIMAADNTANSGYTVACTEWDQNLSQNWTTMYRNGVAVQKTDAYLVPRTRKGLYRRILNPLIAQGRPYHGAWYYIKLRKIGTKLEYWFDDELVMTWNDPNVLREGLVGIWTFIHSMTLAQIKITYDGVRTRPVPVRMLPLEEPKPPVAKPLPVFRTTLNGLPVNTLDAPRWNVNDTVGQSVREAFMAGGASALLLRNRLGAGDMMMRPAASPLFPIDDIAGWRFAAKRTGKAQFNFYYDLGVNNDKGVYQAQRHLYEHISGETFSEGSWVMTGHSEVKPAEDIRADDSGWTEVVAWLPSRLRATLNRKKGLVRLVGFGLAQRDAIQNGIWGNAPGSAYAIAQFAAIRYGTPTMTLGEGETFKAYADADAKTPIPAANPAEFIAKLTAAAKPGLNTVWLDVTAQGVTVRQPLCWLHEPEKLDVRAEWDPTLPDGIRIVHNVGYADQRLAYPTVTANGQKLAPVFNPGASETRRYQLPRTEAMRQALASGTVTVTVVPSGAKSAAEHSVQTLAMNAPERCDAGPALLSLQGFSPFFLSFENGLAEPFLDGKRRWRMLHKGDASDAMRGNYLEVHNRGSQRLETNFRTGFSVAEYPIVQMRYQAADMAHVSLHFAYGEPAFAQLSNNDYSGSVSTRLGRPWVFDEQWRTWTGIVSDAFRADGFNLGKFVGSTLQIRSCGSPDQTGRYSWLALDELVFGPAIRSAEQLAFTPVFFDHDGVKAVFWAKLPGNAAYDDLTADARAKLQWTSAAPGAKLTPTLDGFRPGVNHLVLKAVDQRGRESRPVDLPFLLDQEAPKLSHAFVGTANPLSNGTLLDITAASSGLSPLRLEKVTFAVGKGAQPSALNGWQSSVRHDPGKDVISLNYPYVFRDLLNAAKDGDTLELRLDGLMDGAGNPAPAFTVPIKVDYAKDKTGPAWLEMSAGSSVAWFWNWNGVQSGTAHFRPAQHNGLEVRVNDPGQTPYLLNSSYYSNGGAWVPLKWTPARHPQLAFRLRRNVIRGNVRVDAVLHLADGKTTYTISLDKPEKGAHDLNRTQTFAWKENEWLNFSFDVVRLLREAGVAPDAIAKMSITAITFRHRGGHHGDQLHLDDLWLIGVPDKADAPDLLTWSAYDASGVAALEMTAVGDDGKDAFTQRFDQLHQADLNALRARFEGLRWFRTCAVDKAGNRSLPAWIPVFSPAKPKPASTPAPAPAAKPAPAPAPAAK